MPMTLDLRQLRYFVTIAERGSFTAAAQTLHVAQSALSRHMQLLEDKLGGPLFDRGPRGVVVSESGKLLLRRARFILDEVESTRLEVLARNGELRGAVRLIVPPSISPLLYAPLVDRFHRQHPKVTLHLSEGLGTAVLERLTAGSIDLAIVADQAEDEFIEVTPLVRESMVLVGRIGDPVLAGPTVSLATVFELPLILASAPSWGYRLHKQLGQPTPPLRVRLHVDSIVPLKQIIAKGWGYGALPSSVMSPADADLGLASVPIDGFLASRSLVMSRARPISRAVQEVRLAIIALFAELVACGVIHTPDGQRT